MQALLRHPFVFVAASLALEAAVAFAWFGSGTPGLQAVSRYSGRLGLFWFALPFAAAPWHRLAPSRLSRLALQGRRRLGLAFGAHHLVHLGWLLAYLSAAGKALDPARAAGGLLGYGILVAMMATSTDGAVRRLGPRRWQRLHRAGLWYLWVAFLLTYVPRLQGRVPDAGGGTAEFVACFALIWVLAGLRLLAFVHRLRAVPRRPGGGERPSDRMT